MAQTKGESRVSIHYNPSGDDLVGRIKRAAADMIDLIETIPDRVADQHGVEMDDVLAAERRRLKALAQCDIQHAAKLAVKAATKLELEQ